MNELHIIETIYKPFSSCKKIKCLCGETYKEHNIEHLKCCSVCKEKLTSTKFTVIVNKEISGKVIETIIHPIGFCEKCNGVDLLDYGNREKILSDFKNGNNTCTIFTT